MGNETRWLTAASAILPVGSMRQQNSETMTRPSLPVSGSADVRNREGNRLTGPSIFERIRWGVSEVREVAARHEAPCYTLVFLVEAKTAEELADTYPRS
jgi:hypothetical protein